MPAAIAIAGLLALLAAPLSAGQFRARKDATLVAGEYIVTFDEKRVMASATAPDIAVAAFAHQLAGRHRGAVRRVFRHALQGAVIALPDEAAARALATAPGVELVEPNGVVRASAIQSGATWGLDRIDQRDLPLSSRYSHDSTAASVTVYVIDTGILTSHTQFGGRASHGIDIIDGDFDATDCNGHGTHVAGTVGGSTFGVAKGVRLVAVRVLDCNGSGTDGTVIAGVDWVTANHAGSAVANMSLGGGTSSSLDRAVRGSIAAGVTYAIAAGNDGRDACGTSPARVREALTVGATSSTDARSSFSNYGTCVDLFAPGSAITSAWVPGATATRTMSGTSMATPHVAGVAALYLAAHPGAAPSQVALALTTDATAGRVKSPGSGSPNRLVYSLLDGASQPLGCQGTLYSASLAEDGVAYLPSPYYQSTARGTHSGELDGPPGADFDLYLQKWNGSAWSTVRSGTGSGPDETVSYTGAAGYYRLIVHAYGGGGSYTVCARRP